MLTADPIALIDHTLDVCVRAGTPATALYLTAADWRAVQDHKQRYPTFADFCEKPTAQDPRERYLQVPIEGGAMEFSYATSNVWDAAGRMLQRVVRLDAPEAAFGMAVHPDDPDDD